MYNYDGSDNRKSIWVWTGYNNYEELISDKTEKQIDKIDDMLNGIINYITYGRYIDDKRDVSRVFSGSSNQYTIDVVESILNGCDIYKEK